ncbi:MAG: hypothetical protein ACK5ME_02170 [Parahaliea sp.]
MAMKLIKKEGGYSIYQRGDERYAVKNAGKKPVNGDEKVRILLAAGLISMTAPAPKQAPVAGEGAARTDEAGEEGEAAE